MKGAEFPRPGGNMISAWAHAYADTDDPAAQRELVRAIETVAGRFNAERYPENDGLPYAFGAAQWDAPRADDYNPKSVTQLVREVGVARSPPLPDSTKGVLRELSRRSDRVLTEKSPLPKATSRTGTYYDTLTRSDDLMLASYELSQALAPSTVNVENAPELPGYVLTLKKNYPNPFSETTTIDHRLAREARVVVEVYDVLGRRVATMNEGMQARGSHRTVFDAGQLASGTYLYRLRIGGRAVTRKMVLVR